MADDERAAKAARAKAMLKKRQQQKKTAIPTAESVPNTPSSPASRALSPAPSQTQTANDTGSVINEFGEILTSKSPPIESQALANGDDGPVNFEHAKKLEEYSSKLTDQSQTISLLVSEKASLANSLERFEGVDAKLRETEAQLESKNKSLSDLQSAFSELEEEKSLILYRLTTSESLSSQTSSKLREQERELHTSHQETETLRSQLDNQKRRIRELEDQVQNDDRVEVLEKTLKNTQERAEELSFQLSKFKQSYEKLNSEHTDLREQFESKSDAYEDMAKKYSDLQTSFATIKDELSSITSERDSLLSSTETLTMQVQTAEHTAADLGSKLGQSTSELSNLARQLDSTQAELRSAIRKADDAEHSQQSLQEEARSLMDSLNELRPKVVALTGEKLELTEKVEQLTRSLTQRDASIAELEALLDQLQQTDSEGQARYDHLVKERDSERASAEKTIAVLQQTLSDLQQQHDDITASSRELEADRSRQRQIAVRQQEEIDNLQIDKRAQSEEISTLQERLEERQRAEEDAQRMLEELQVEVESLRSDLAAKEDEISRVRQAAASPSPSQLPPNLSDEFQSALKQQYELELSSAQSTIRNLETTIYDAESRQLHMQKQLASMEDELDQLRSIAKTKKPHAFARRDSFSRRTSDDLRRTSFASNRSDSAGRLQSSEFIDQGLPLTTRHQRHVSLAMLQARMYSEAETASLHQASKSNRAHGQAPGSPSHGHASFASVSSTYQLRRPQFLDESHVFWCASCKGDLIVL